ncbi:MAG: hypothetical protein GX102_04475 [Porphyromonadaceae bacterium]|nr:hypothetical protein [Porphyromonadaceae bacterium]
MKLYLLLILTLLFPPFLVSQEFKYNTELHFFFDNAEFKRSSYAIDQTMAGVTLTQEIGWKFDGKHFIMGGVDAMKSLGGHEILNDIHLLAYYQLKDPNALFKVGAFHRHDLLDDYSNFFFQDSIDFYKHTMEGLYFLKGNEEQFVKLWLDWTGLQSMEERESFFVGASAYKEFGKMFFVDFQSYMFHYATTRPNPENLSVSDNALGQLSLGVKYANNQGLDNLKFSAGILAGYERDRRNMDDYRTPLGLVLRGEVDYKGFGTENLFYYGQNRMAFYEEYGNNLYWGNPFLRSNTYFQNKIYWKFLDTDRVHAQIAARTHVSEGKVFFEQMLTLSAHINNYEPKRIQRAPTFWERIFPRRGRALDGITM